METLELPAAIKVASPEYQSGILSLKLRKRGSRPEIRTPIGSTKNCRLAISRTRNVRGGRIELPYFEVEARCLNPLGYAGDFFPSKLFGGSPPVAVGTTNHALLNLPQNRFPTSTQRTTENKTFGSRVNVVKL